MEPVAAGEPEGLAAPERALLETLLLEAPVGFALYDVDLRWRRINRTLAETNGLPMETHLGRLPSGDAAARARTPRLLSRLPAVAAAYERGEIPTAHIRAIVRVASNPRVAALLPIADPVFAEQAAEDGHREFLRWLRAWEVLADVDGAADDAATHHARRHIDLVENPDGGLAFAGSLGALEGAAFREVFDRFVEAELMADWAEARARKGDAATDADLARTPRQR